MLLNISVLQSNLCVFVFLHLICFASPVWRIVFFAVFSEICLSLSEGAQTNRGVSFTVLGKWTECGGAHIVRSSDGILPVPICRAFHIPS